MFRLALPGRPPCCGDDISVQPELRRHSLAPPCLSLPKPAIMCCARACPRCKAAWWRPGEAELTVVEWRECKLPLRFPRPDRLERANMASRNYGDMPLGSQPLLPQYTYSRAGQRARPKTQTFVVSAQGAVCAEPPADEKAFDPRAHVRLRIARSCRAARARGRGIAHKARNAR
jgi:hypothetical protein